MTGFHFNHFVLFLPVDMLLLFIFDSTVQLVIVFHLDSCSSTHHHLHIPPSSTTINNHHYQPLPSALLTCGEPAKIYHPNIIALAGHSKTILGLA